MNSMRCPVDSAVLLYIYSHRARLYSPLSTLQLRVAYLENFLTLPIPSWTIIPPRVFRHLLLFLCFCTVLLAGLNEKLLCNLARMSLREELDIFLAEEARYDEESRIREREMQWLNDALEDCTLIECANQGNSQFDMSKSRTDVPGDAM